MTTHFPLASCFKFEDLTLGQIFELTRSFSKEDVDDFAALSGDYSPLHVDPIYAASTEFGSPVVHGILLAALFSQLIGMRVPGQPALYLGQDLTFRRPVRIGEPVRAIVKIIGKSEATRTLVLTTEIRSEDDKVLVMGTAKVKVRDDLPVVRLSLNASKPIALIPGRRVALVTGASRGIGAQIAKTLAEKGFAVVVNYLSNASRALHVVHEIECAGGVAVAMQADVRDALSVQALLKQIVVTLGPPQVLVNAAIGAFNSRAVSELPWSDFEAHLDYQVKAVLLLCQGVYPLMKAGGHGAIVNILSQVTADVPATGMADYVAAKHALLGLSKAMAAEWAPDLIRVNMVSPGLTRTDLTEHYPERIFKMEAARTPLKRMATPLDIANAVAYLAGDESSFLTGVNIFVTGGQVML